MIRKFTKVSWTTYHVLDTFFSIQKGIFALHKN